MRISSYDNLQKKHQPCALGAHQLEFVHKVGQSKAVVLPGGRRYVLRRTSRHLVFAEIFPMVKCWAVKHILPVLNAKQLLCPDL